MNKQMNSQTTSKLSQKESQYNLTVTPMWETKKGNLRSIVIGPEQFDNLQKVKVGGLLIIKYIDNPKSEKSPHAYLEYITPEKTLASKEEYKKAPEDSL